MSAKQPFQWAIIGGGPAGIAAVGKLIDGGIDPSLILWVDPYFKVGDLGRLWSNVSSNTSVGLFTQFLNSASSFSYQQAAGAFSLTDLSPQDTCMLKEVVQPLQWVSDTLRQQVHSVETTIQSMNLVNRMWYLSTNDQTFKAYNVILATGAVPLSLNHPGVDVLAFDVAIDKERLAQTVNLNHTYGVFGSSHSAIIILRHLLELGVKKVINFYRSPSRYAINMGDWILFDNTGLKGQTAAWSRENIDGCLPSNLIRCNVNAPHLAHYLQECSQVIYAVGFERRNTVMMDDYEHIHCNPHVGIIGPGLFGFGIAYPEKKADPLGNFESQVGLWKFMNYLNKVLPIWLKYPA